MEDQSIGEPIHAYIVNEFLLGSDERFTSESLLIEEGIVDSMGIMEIVDFIEDEFDIRINESELVAENLGSVAQMSAFVARKRRDGHAVADEAGC